MIRPIVVACGALMLAGCASVDPKPAFQDVQRTVSARTGQKLESLSPETERAVRELSQRELTADTAVQIALLNNRNLQATLEEIGVSQADLAQATRLKNPELSLQARFPNRPPSAANAEIQAAQDFLDILLMPLRKKVATAQLEQTKLHVADEVLKLVADVKTAFYTLQARQQLLAGMNVILNANETAAEFAQRQRAAGTMNELDASTHRSTYLQTRAEVAKLALQVRADREALTRLLGLTEWKIADTLPAMPEHENALDELEAFAVQQRLDLQAAHRDVEAVAQALTLRSNTRWFPAGVQLGVSSERDTSRQVVTGPSLHLEVPLFDQGQADVARLQAQHRQAQRRVEALETEIRSEVREARAAVVAERELAEQYGTELLPLRKQILGLAVQQYNFMLKGQYELLAAKQNEVEAERGYVEAWRDYWIARVALERAVGGRLP